MGKEGWGAVWGPLPSTFLEFNTYYVQNLHTKIARGNASRLRLQGGYNR